MLKKFKLSVCCIMTMVLLFTFTCVSAFADTKTVSVTTNKYFTCTGPEISGNIQSVQNSTYSYNDGAYSGTLSFTQINNVSVVNVSSTIYQVTVNVTYSGTVSSYTPPTTKSVTVTVDRSFTCDGPQINSNMTSIQNSTYYYNDGSFSGTLSFASLTVSSVTVVGQGYYGSIYHFIVNATYSGTVTSY